MHIFFTIAYFALLFESNLITHWTSVPACLAQFFVLNPVMWSVLAHDRHSCWESRINLGHFAREWNTLASVHFFLYNYSIAQTGPAASAPRVHAQPY